MRSLKYIPAALFCALIAQMAGEARAGSRLVCDTPVYRYAMYRWQPTPYELYFFHEGAIDEKHQAVHTAAAHQAESKESPLNLVVLPINFTEDKELLGIPPDVKQAWLKRTDKSLPAYVLVTPRGGHVYSGPLAEDDIAAIAHSPVRKQMAKLLEEGCAGVFLLLTSPPASEAIKREKSLKRAAQALAEGRIDAHLFLDDLAAPSDEQAEKEVAAVVADVENGKLKLYDGLAAVGDQPGNANGESNRVASDTPKHKVGLIKVSRDDLREKWLIESLLAAEPDLRDFYEPMVFAVYGRGRSLPPYVGRGITRDNLAECIEFITGACSCTVKEQNPGVDLLVSYDWETAAASLADRFGSEEGNESQFGPDQFFPELIIPSKAEASSETSATANNDASNPDTQENGLLSAESGEQSKQGQKETGGETDAETGAESENAGDSDASSDTSPADASRRVATNRSSQPDDIETASTTSSWSLWTIAGGMIIAMFLLLGATFIVLRPSRP